MSDQDESDTTPGHYEISLGDDDNFDENTNDFSHSQSDSPEVDRSQSH